MIRYITRNAGVRMASAGEYWRIAVTLLPRLRLSVLSIAHCLGSMSSGHHPAGGSCSRAPAWATTTSMTTPTAMKTAVRLSGVRIAANAAMNGTAPQPIAPVTRPTLAARFSGYHLATVAVHVA